MKLTQEEFDNTALRFAEALAAYYSKEIEKHHHHNIVKYANEWSVDWYQDENNRQKDLHNFVNNEKVKQKDFDETVLRFVKALIPNFNNQNLFKENSLALTSISRMRILEHARGLAIAWYQRENARQNNFKELLTELDKKI